MGKTRSIEGKRLDLEHSLRGVSLQVGNAFEKVKTDRELKQIASTPSETHAFKVTNYTALNGLLSKLQQSIIHTEGEAQAGPQPLSTQRKPPVCTPALCPTSSEGLSELSPGQAFAGHLCRGNGVPNPPLP